MRRRATGRIIEACGACNLVGPSHLEAHSQRPEAGEAESLGIGGGVPSVGASRPVQRCSPPPLGKESPSSLPPHINPAETPLRRTRFRARRRPCQGATPTSPRCSSTSRRFCALSLRAHRGRFAPQLPQYGTHHGKMFLLKFASGVRVVITTANLVEQDLTGKSQGVWYQDFPLGEGAGACDFEVRPARPGRLPEPRLDGLPE